MKYCISCGHKLKNNQETCSECGTRHSLRSSGSETRTVKETEPNKNKRKKVPTIIGIIGAALILLSIFTGLYFNEKKQSDPSLVISQFEKAIKDQDTRKIMSLIKQGDARLEADKEMVEAYLEYLNADPQLLDSSITELFRKANLIEKNSSVHASNEKQANEWFDISKGDKKWGLIPQYQVEIKPFYVEVNSSLSDTVIFLNGEEKGEVNDDTPVKIGPILPGNYEVEAKYTGTYSTLEDKKKLDFSKAEDNVLKVGIQLTGSYITFVTDPDADIYINGRKSSINPSSAVDIGPIATDGSVTVYAELETDDDTLKSETVTIQNDKDVYLDFDYSAASLVKSPETEVVSIEDSSDSSDMSESSDTSDTSAFTGVDDRSDVKNTIRAHYGAISNDDFATAHSLFSAARQSKVPLAGFSKGLQENIRNEVNVVEVESVNGNMATAYFEMTSYDLKKDGSTVVKNWGGRWILVKEVGYWSLDDPTIKLLDSE
jgi:membrane-associated protein TcaA